MKQPTARLRFLGQLAIYRCLTTRQSVAAGLASEQMTRRYLRELASEGLIQMVPLQADNQTGRPENLALPTPKGLKTLGLSGKKPIQQRFYAHQYHVNWCRIQFEELREHRLIPLFRVRSVNGFWPDGIITLKSKEMNKTLLFFLEMDMGTEALSSKRPGNLREKIDAYRNLFLTGGYKSLASSSGTLKGFRVLFVLSSASRLRSFTRLCSQQSPCPFVWSTDYRSLCDNGAGSKIWLKGGNTSERFSILGSLAPQ